VVGVGKRQGVGAVVGVTGRAAGGGGGVASRVAAAPRQSSSAAVAAKAKAQVGGRKTLVLDDGEEETGVVDRRDTQSPVEKCFAALQAIKKSVSAVRTVRRNTQVVSPYHPSCGCGAPACLTW
jgi:hypothetical protein